MRPQRLAADHTTSRDVPRALKRCFNEAAAISCGSRTAAQSRRRRTAASMRPQRLAADHHGALDRLHMGTVASMRPQRLAADHPWPLGHRTERCFRFNEAAAISCGSRAARALPGSVQMASMRPQRLAADHAAERRARSLARGASMRPQRLAADHLAAVRVG